MDDTRKVRISKFLSRILRHAPDDLRLVLEPGGWVAIEHLLAGAHVAGFPLARAELDAVVSTSDKQRFAIDDTGTRIRANQGHSTEVDLELEPADPPDELYHGTGEQNLPAILHVGLRKMARHHVHLSHEADTAIKVGQRHETPRILVVDAAGMRADGHTFFRSANGVWLVESVPPQYLRVL